MKNKFVFSSISLTLLWYSAQCFKYNAKANIILTAKALFGSDDNRRSTTSKRKTNQRKIIGFRNDTEGLPYFNGEKNEEEAFQVEEVKVVEDKLVVGSNDAVFVISSNSFAQTTGKIMHDQILDWSSRNASSCKTSDKCRTAIAIIKMIEPNVIFICGESVGSLSCRHYQWQNGEIVQKYSTLETEEISVPFRTTNYSSSFTYLLSSSASKRNLYLAFGSDSQQFQSDIVRTKLSQKQTHDLPPVLNRADDGTFFTVDINARPSWLQKPYFVGMIETDEKVFIFFREEAIEAAYEKETPTFSRVAQICKNDGGRSKHLPLNGKWTSFFKARLNCSIPGKWPFYFNEIQHMTAPVMFNGKMTIFATFVTSDEAIPASAICAFTMFDIASAMAGNFKEQHKTARYWRNRIPDFPQPHPSICNNNVYKNGETLKFIREHCYMSDAVNALGSRPLFTLVNSRFTSFAFETLENLMENGNKTNRFTLFYIGTQEGKLLKVAVDSNFPASNFGAVFSEEWKLFRPDVCSTPNLNAEDIQESNRQKMRVKHVSLIPKSDFIIVTFTSCVISVPKKSCYFYKCKSACIRSGNPYCGWMSSYCVPVTPRNRLNIRQDISKEIAGVDSCNPKAEANIDPPGQTLSRNRCVYPDTIVYSLIGSLAAAFIVLLVLAILLLVNCSNSNSCMMFSPKQKKKQKEIATCKDQVTASPNSRSIQLVSRKFSSVQHNETSFSYSNKQTWSREQNRRVVSKPVPLNQPCPRQPYNPKQVQVVLNMAPQDTSSYDDTSWSEDAFESETFSNFNPGNTSNHLTLDDRRELMKSVPALKCGKAVVVGVAHPIKHTSGKLSQVVKPTFISHTPAARHYSSDSHTYVEMEDGDQSATNSPLLNPTVGSLHLRTNVTVQQVDATRKIAERQLKTDNSYKGYEMMTSFSPPKNERENFEERLPPPPENLISPLHNQEDIAPINSSNQTTSFHESTQSTLQGKQDDARFRKKAQNSFYKEPLQGKNKSHENQSLVVQSVSNESTSSGFLSSSPQTSFIGRRGLDETIALLNNQRLDIGDNKKIIAENVYDEVFEDLPGLKECDTYDSISMHTSLQAQDDRKIDYPDPEYCCESDDTEADNELAQVGKAEIPLEIPGNQPNNEDLNKKKKSLKIFRSKKNKNSKKQAHSFNEEPFFSPSYDEEPVVPIIEGWQEIEFNSESLLKNNNGSLGSVDDSCINRSKNSTSKQKHHGFLTMRPKNHLRQKLPKLRNTDKEWTAGNNPTPVPTPAVPK